MLFAKNVSSCETQLVVVFSTTQRFENSARIDCVQFLLGFYQSSFESIEESKRTGLKKMGMDFRWYFATGSIRVFFAFHLIFLFHKHKTLKGLFFTFKFGNYPCCNSLETYIMWCDWHHWQFWPCQIQTNKWNCRSIEWNVYIYLCMYDVYRYLFKSNVCILYIYIYFLHFRFFCASLLCPSWFCTWQIWRRLIRICWWDVTSPTNKSPSTWPQMS